MKFLFALLFLVLTGHLTGCRSTSARSTVKITDSQIVDLSLQENKYLHAVVKMTFVAQDFQNVDDRGFGMIFPVCTGTFVAIDRIVTATECIKNYYEKEMRGIIDQTYGITTPADFGFKLGDQLVVAKDQISRMDHFPEEAKNFGITVISLSPNLRESLKEVHRGQFIPLAEGGFVEGRRVYLAGYGWADGNTKEGFGDLRIGSNLIQKKNVSRLDKFGLIHLGGTRLSYANKQKLLDLLAAIDQDETATPEVISMYRQSIFEAIYESEGTPETDLPPQAEHQQASMTGSGDLGSPLLSEEGKLLGVAAFASASTEDQDLGYDEDYRHGFISVFAPTFSEAALSFFRQL